MVGHSIGATGTWPLSLAAWNKHCGTYVVQLYSHEMSFTIMMCAHLLTRASSNNHRL